MSVVFKENTSCAAEFFAILPNDWHDDIASVWDDYKSSAKIYVLEENNNIVGGGIVFSTLSPDLRAVPEIAQKYYQKGMLYLAFIWINETHREKGLGSFWLTQLLKQQPTQGFWLTIEDLKLKGFYENVGFKLGKSYMNEGIEEWVMEFLP